MKLSYNVKENRLKECKRLIEKYKILQGYSKIKELNNFDSAIRKYGDNLNTLAIELGYDLEELYPTRKPEGYYDNFEIIKNKICNFIKENNRFPSQAEINKNLHIDNRHLAKFGGIYEIKRKLNYDDKNDLKDDTGFYNKSLEEYYVAQFLYHNNISCKREGKIIELYNYLYDFMIEDIYNNKYYIEVWGYNSGTSERAIKYKEKMKKKIKIYKDNNLNLISLNPELFENKKYEDINLSLYNIFKDLLNLKFKKLDNKIFIPNRNYTDEELKNEIMKYSKDGITIPTKDYLESIQKLTLFKEINKRFGTVYNFSKKYNLKTEHYYKNYWCEETIFNTFDNMILNFGKILNKTECQNEKYKNIDFLKGFVGGIRRNGGFVENRIKYYEHLIKYNRHIPNEEILVLKNMLSHKAPYNRIHNKYDNRIKNILEAI